MSTESKTRTENTLNGLSLHDDLVDWVNQFWIAKKVEGIVPNTQVFYKQQLGHFLRFCEGQALARVQELTPTHIRQYITWHSETGHNPGGVHAAYRVLRTFLLWYEYEVDPEGWKNPIKRVKAPRLSLSPLDPAPIVDIFKMVATCTGKKFYDLRDKAILLFLLDTGGRAREVLSIEGGDLNLISGEVHIRHGKGGKPRTVFIGRLTRRAVRHYLRERHDDCPALWATLAGDRLGYSGLWKMISIRAKLARVPRPTIHSFRRAFALQSLKNGMDIYSLQKIMGHSSFKVMDRYLKFSSDDLKESHSRFSPVDKR